MTDFTFLPQLHQGGQCLVKRRVFSVLMHIAEAAEKIGGPRWPVQLIQIDVIRLQAAQAAVHGCANVRTGQLRPIADVRHPVAGTCYFGSQNHPLARAARFQPAADVLLGQPLCFPLRRHRIHFGGIDKINALRQRIIHLLMRLRLRILLPPGHGPQAQLAHPQIAVAQAAFLNQVVHATPLCDSGCCCRRPPNLETLRHRTLADLNTIGTALQRSFQQQYKITVYKPAQADILQCMHSS